MWTRVSMIAVLFGTVALGVAVLTAAKEASDKAADTPAKAPTGGKKVVCLGTADTDEGIVLIFPENFPSHSKVTKVLVKVGDTVQTDQPLLEFDTRLAANKVEQAEKAVAIAKLESTKGDVAIKVREALLNAADSELAAQQKILEQKQSELIEYKRLFTTNKNQAEVEAKEAEVESQKLKLLAAKWSQQAAKANDLTPGVNVATETVKRYELLVKEAKLGVEYLACKAPGEGIIVRSFVTGGMTFGPQTREPAFWFLKTAPLVVRAEVAQEFARRISPGLAAKIEDEADPSQTWTGKVTKVRDQFLPKRPTGGGADFLQASDERVLECLVSIDAVAAGTPLPRYGQKLRVTIGE